MILHSFGSSGATSMSISSAARPWNRILSNVLRLLTYTFQANGCSAETAQSTVQSCAPNNPSNAICIQSWQIALLWSIDGHRQVCRRNATRQSTRLPLAEASPRGMPVIVAKRGPAPGQTGRFRGVWPGRPVPVPRVATIPVRLRGGDRRSPFSRPAYHEKG